MRISVSLPLLCFLAFSLSSAQTVIISDYEGCYNVAEKPTSSSTIIAKIKIINVSEFVDLDDFQGTVNFKAEVKKVFEGILVDSIVYISYKLNSTILDNSFQKELDSIQEGKNYRVSLSIKPNNSYLHAVKLTLL